MLAPTVGPLVRSGVTAMLRDMAEPWQKEARKHSELDARTLLVLPTVWPSRPTSSTGGSAATRRGAVRERGGYALPQQLSVCRCSRSSLRPTALRLQYVASSPCCYAEHSVNSTDLVPTAIAAEPVERRPDLTPALPNVR